MSTELPSTFINFVPDAIQLTVGTVDPAYTLSTSNTFLVISAAVETYAASSNPIVGTPTTQVASTPVAVVPPQLNLPIQL